MTTEQPTPETDAGVWIVEDDGSFIGVYEDELQALRHANESMYYTATFRPFGRAY